MDLKQLLTSALFVPAAVHLSGCAIADAGARNASTDGADREVVELEAAQRRVASLEQELSEKDLLLTQSELRGSTPPVTPVTSLFPPNAEAGQCYARVLIPARFNMTSETVLVREATARISVIPATYETVQERVLVKEASSRFEVVPAVYEEVQERVMISPDSERLVEVPAEYETVTDRVLDQAAHTVWKRGPAAGQAGNVLSEQVTDTGEIMCLVEVPATYRTITRQVVARPARTDSIAVPAQYETVTKLVVSQPGTTREILVPAEYATREVTRLIRAAQQQSTDIAAEYETVTRNEKISEESLEWRSVMCEVNMTFDNITALQTALSSEGFYQGPVDGIIGPMTLSAASRYALQNSLPAGSNYITLDVIESLGLGERIASLR